MTSRYDVAAADMAREDRQAARIAELEQQNAALRDALRKKGAALSVANAILTGRCDDVNGGMAQITAALAATEVR